MTIHNKLLLISASDKLPGVQELLSCKYGIDVDIVSTKRIFDEGYITFICRISNLIKEQGYYQGVFGITDIGSFVAAIITDKSGLSTHLSQVLYSIQNKLLYREKEVNISPAYRVNFCRADIGCRHLPPPFFIKPVKSILSRYSNRLSSHTLIEDHILKYKACLIQDNTILANLLAFARIDDSLLNTFIVEEVLEGVQFTVDVAIFKNDFKILSIVKSTFLDKTRSFDKFILANEPSLSILQDQVQNLLKEVIPQLNLTSTIINIEIKFNEQKSELKIIEINTRVSSQFSFIIDKMTGINVYALNALLVLKQYSQARDLINKSCGSMYNISASCVLRMEKDAYIKKTPSENTIINLQNQYNVRIKNLVKAGARLSSKPKDPDTYRYCIVDVCAQSHDELNSILQQVQSTLGYIFTD